MSYHYAETVNIEGIRKVKGDEFWHILYKFGGKDTYDRVDKKTAMSVLRKIEKHFKKHSEHNS